MKNRQRRVAVVIPCWNDGRFVGQAVASVQKQREPCELVVVDDGSTEAATVDQLFALEQSGVTVIRQPNGGVAMARMTAVAHTTAPYVFPLDADDRLAEDILHELADALDASPSSAAAWGDNRAFGAIDWVFPTWRTLDPWLVTYVNRLPVSCLYRRTALLECGGWSLAEGYEDWDLWFRLAARGWSGTHIGRIHLEYRQHHEPRMLARERERHDETLQRFRESHSELFRNRRLSARRTLAPRRLQLAYRGIDALPRIGESGRHRMYDIALRTLVPATRPIVDGTPQTSPVIVAAARLGNVLRRRLPTRRVARPSLATRPD